MGIGTVEDLAGGLSGPGSLIGLDMGSKTIGVAVSDTLRSIASPLQGVARAKSFAKTAEALLAILAREKSLGLVIGLPLSMDGGDSASTQSVRAFARNISALTPLPIALWDERWSTAAVTRTLLEADTSRRRRAEVVDKMAAAYILQGALDRLRILSRS
ncbi:Putative pre-16S rRNA nuclease [Alphaproteobacteria bacterium SO-S41]|nr:Putative pre-16S rRNA nuclease [Alphaproteobacteria bacterium SO-S41]